MPHVRGSFWPAGGPCGEGFGSGKRVLRRGPQVLTRRSNPWPAEGRSWDGVGWTWRRSGPDGHRRDGGRRAAEIAIESLPEGLRSQARPRAGCRRGPPRTCCPAETAAQGFKRRLGPGVAWAPARLASCDGTAAYGFPDCNVPGQLKLALSAARRGRAHMVTR